MFIVTTNDIPGYRIVNVMGEVMGLTVRSTSFGQSFSSSFQALGGGEMPEFSRVMFESRNEATARMWGEAVARGANAIIAARFDTGAIGSFFEVCAYGTAVVVEPVQVAATAPPPAV